MATTLLAEESQNYGHFAELNPEDPQAQKLDLSALSIHTDESNTVATVVIKRWPNLFGVQKECWITNSTCILGFVLAYEGYGKGIAEWDQIAWTIPNTATGIEMVVVLQFPDIALNVDKVLH